MKNPIHEHTQNPPADALMSEVEVLQRWLALSRTALRAARHRGRIAWVRGKRGTAWYRPSAIETYISKELEQPCRAHAHETSLNLAANGSLRSQAAPASTVSGMTPEMEELAAQASAQRIFKKPRGSSRN